MGEANRYQQIIEKVFLDRYKKGAKHVTFKREDITAAASKLGIDLPKNLGDVIYSFRYRASLPRKVRSCAPKGTEWVILPAGSGRYRFEASAFAQILPSKMLAETKIPNATPGVIEMYALSDEQALLAKLRYNRLVDIFSGVTCYSLQNHLRTAVKGMGQIETDEVYVGVDRKGAHYIFPVQAKAGKDKLNIVQIEQDLAMCKSKFPNLVSRPVAAQFLDVTLIALFELEKTRKGISVACEKHYRLVAPDEISPQDLKNYRERLNGC